MFRTRHDRPSVDNAILVEAGQSIYSLRPPNSRPEDPLARPAASGA